MVTDTCGPVYPDSCGRMVTRLASGAAVVQCAGLIK